MQRQHSLFDLSDMSTSADTLISGFLRHATILQSAALESDDRTTSI